MKIILPSGEMYQEMADVYYGNVRDFCWNPRIQCQTEKWLEINTETESKCMTDPQRDPHTELIIFCYTHHLKEFVEKMLPNIHTKFKLITHNSDAVITDEQYETISRHEGLVQWYGQNPQTTKDHPKLTVIPIGFGNGQWPHGDRRSIEDAMQQNCDNNYKKTKDIYFNFNTESHPEIREECEMRMYEKGIPRLENVQYGWHLKRMQEYKWCICPEGNGPDTHRLWECVYMRVIPIVIETPFIQNICRNYPEMPMVILKSWEELSLETLQNQPYCQREINEKFEKTIQRIGDTVAKIRPSRIPKTIYQTWKTKNIHIKMMEIQKRMKNVNLNYTYEWFDDQEMDAYVEKTQTEEIKECYRKLNIGAAKADLWRYLILYERGGIYVDMDAEITGKLDKLIQSTDRAIISREGNPGWFLQWMMIFEARHPILKRTIELCIENIKGEKEGSVFEITGPKVFTEAIRECTGNENAYYDKDRVVTDEIGNECCRWYGIDFPNYGKFKHEWSSVLYEKNIHWTVEEKQQNMYRQHPVVEKICTFENLGQQGRLGNALFQYAMLLGFSEKKGVIPKLPWNIKEKTHHSQKCMLDAFKLTASPIDPGASRPAYTYVEQCDGGHYDANIWNQPGEINLQGQFESELYFNDIRDRIKQEFQLKSEKKYRKEKIGIHFRRGDDVTINHHEYTTEEYNEKFIKKAFEYITSHTEINLENLEVMIFTGGTREAEGTWEYARDEASDIEWCKTFMQTHFPNIKIKMSKEQCPEMNSVLDDFMRMQNCEIFIINSVSSMGWWAGYLNTDKNKQIIVSPAKTKSETTYWPSEFIQINVDA